MTNTNKIITGIIVLVILAGGLLLFTGKSSPSAPGEQPTTTLQTSTVNSTTTAAGSTSSNQSAMADPWTVFTDYLATAKAHDIAGLAAVTYKLSDTCKDPKQTAACFVKMDNAYKIGSVLKKADFVNRWEDSKQMILSTNLMSTTTTAYIGYSKSMILFVKDPMGNLKLLTFKPDELWTVPNNKASTTAELQAELNDMVRDSDQDGQTDQIENCIFPQTFVVIKCTKTNPLKRDSLGDGWWDGVRGYITQ